MSERRYIFAPAQICRIVASLGFLSKAVFAFEISDYYSLRNSERPNREHTEYIVLHTTEAPFNSSLKKVHANGETHYLVASDGHVYRIVRKGKVAFHAGRSMWNGVRDLDNWSIGIEVVGYHDRDITREQYEALNQLLAQIQEIYGIPDDKVLTHSMVAYGTPNKWHKRSHRGRKRCGMMFADSRVRRRLGLRDEPSFDPDVQAGRLAVGDKFLAAALYGSAREQDVAVAQRYSPATGTSAEGPTGAGEPGNALESAREIGKDGNTAEDIAGTEYNRKTTIYFFSDGVVCRGDELSESELKALPDGTKVLVGYVCGGHVTMERGAYDICGARWNFPSTLYRFPDGTIVPGDKVRENAIPKNTLVFFIQ